MLETDLIYSIFQMVHTLEISLREMRIPELSAGGWRIYVSIKRYKNRKAEYRESF
jgi:hypothetical protein